MTDTDITFEETTMHAFVTGASGWIGSAVVPDLLAAGHQVTGLARSDASAASLQAAGADVVRGSIEDLEVLRDAAAASDGVIHLAFDHEVAFSGDFATAVDTDRRVVEVFGDALADSGRPLVVASGLLGLAPGTVATEHDGHDVAAGASGPVGRHATGEVALSLAGRGVRSSIVRLAPTVHGAGDTGFVPRLIDIARTTGTAAYVDDGSQRWPAVHRSDAAQLLRVAFEQATPGTTLHAAADEGVSQRAIAEAFARHLDIPTASIPAADSSEHFAWLAPMVALDSPASSAITRALLGWSPTGPSLLDDLDQGHYFET
jgi:nucleoside-diphosphate-sugar epimerase